MGAEGGGSQGNSPNRPAPLNSYASRSHAAHAPALTVEGTPTASHRPASFHSPGRFAMKSLAASALAAALLAASTTSASAAEITRVYANPNAPIASLTRVPAGYDLVFVSGATPGAQGQPRPVGTEAQTLDVLNKISALLKDQGMTMGDVVVMRVFLGVDPDKGGHADRAGMNKAFATFFGTPDQPNKPARTTIAINDNAPGNFVEIDAIAAKKPEPVKAKSKKK